MNKIDILCGTTYIPEYKIEFIPPTKEEIRRQNIAYLIDDIKLFGLHCLGIIGYFLLGYSFINFIKWSL